MTAILTSVVKPNKRKLLDLSRKYETLPNQWSECRGLCAE
jgi:hypothetical protein